MGKRADLGRMASSLEQLATVPTARNTAKPDRKEKFPLLGRLTLAVGGRPKKVQAGITARRSFPITAYVGPNGGGKSLCMVLDTLPTMAGIRWECDNPGHLHTQQGIYSGYRRIISTVKLLELRERVLDEIGPTSRWDRPTHPHYDEFRDFDQLLTAEHADVLADEIVGIASSRDSQRMDTRVSNVLMQLRRRDVTFRWTAPNWARADKMIREVTQAVVECRGYFPGRPLVSTSDAAGLWAPKRVFRFTTYDAMEFEEWSAGKREKQDPIIRHWYKGPGSDAFRAYDTLDAVTMVQSPSPTDECDVCGGRVVRKTCSCNSHSSRRASGARALELDSVA